MKRTIRFLPSEMVEIYRDSLASMDIFFVPVPLHKKRQSERGFNQASVIAKALGKALQVEVYDILKREIYTTSQAQLSKRERYSNVKGVFSIRKNRLPVGVPVLVDDVATTLSTLQECSLVLKKSGYTRVGAIAIARG